MFLMMHHLIFINIVSDNGKDYLGFIKVDTSGWFQGIDIKFGNPGLRCLPVRTLKWQILVKIGYNMAVIYKCLW